MEDEVDEGGGWLARPNAIWQDQYYYMSFKHTVPHCIVTYLLTYLLANSMHKLCVRMCVLRILKHGYRIRKL